MLPTIIVLAAVAVMIGLGLWQVGRAGEKEALLARYQAAAGLPAVALPSGAEADEAPLFRRSAARCTPRGESRVVAGRDAAGRSGFAHRIECTEGFRAEIGWSDRPQPVRWAGGAIAGVIAPDPERGWLLVAGEGQAGLTTSAAPDVTQIPNNHRSYAFQWFAFALAALIIYGLALRGRRGQAA